VARAVDLDDAWLLLGRACLPNTKLPQRRTPTDKPQTTATTTQETRKGCVLRGLVGNNPKVTASQAAHQQSRASPSPMSMPHYFWARLFTVLPFHFHMPNTTISIAIRTDTSISICLSHYQVAALHYAVVFLQRQKGSPPLAPACPCSCPARSRQTKQPQNYAGISAFAPRVDLVHRAALLELFNLFFSSISHPRSPGLQQQIDLAFWERATAGRRRRRRTGYCKAREPKNCPSLSPLRARGGPSRFGQGQVETTIASKLRRGLVCVAWEASRPACGA